MYKIDTENNAVIKLHQRSFSDLGFSERHHLQEWIAKSPDLLGEEFLIIQKEFAGFSETLERLDLLALDKQGSLVIIENKLDDTGRDVTWQALKYASYCSSLSRDHIKKIYQAYLDKVSPGSTAEERLSEFFDETDYEDLVLNKGVTQRIILIAAKFRKEVTSTVLWLLNFKIRLQCFRAIPYSMGNDLFLAVEQLIPTHDAEDYMIGMAEKAQDDLESRTELKQRHILRRDFWTELLSQMNARSELFQNISPGVHSYISAGSGIRGVGFNFCVTKSCGRCELYIDRGIKEENEFVFDELVKQRTTIEGTFGSPLVWQRLDEKRACRIKLETPGSLFEKETWKPTLERMADNMLRLEKAMREPLQQISPKLKAWTQDIEEITA